MWLNILFETINYFKKLNENKLFLKYYNGKDYKE